MSHPISDLYEVYDKIWELLSQGAESSKSDYHLTSLATLSGATVRARTVILRKTLKDKKSLIFHTDSRSSKISEIRGNPYVSLLFYSKEDKIQIRAEGKASVYFEGDLFDMQWKNSKPLSRRCYLIEPGPGKVMPKPSSGIPSNLKDRAPDEKESEPGKKNFCVVSIKVSYFEWLNLHSEGHIRAKFELEESEYSGYWLMP